MKTNLSFLFLLYFAFAFAQYSPLLNDENSWVYSSFSWDFENGEMYYTDYQIRMTGESIQFNDKDYKAFEQRSRSRIDNVPQSEWSDWEPTVFYLSENIAEKKIYVYYSEVFLWHEAGEYLLYDFNMEIGDFMTFEGFIEGNNAESAEITDITYETVYGMDDIKTFHFANQNEFQFEVYEGIGSTHGLFTSSFMWDAGWQLTDFGQNLSTTEINSSKSTVYPNPFTNQIQIDSEKPIQHLELFDVNGKLILSKKSISELNSNLNQLQKGMYILQITYPNQQKETIKLIKK